jgi:hypothetical protein
MRPDRESAMALGGDVDLGIHDGVLRARVAFRYLAVAGFSRPRRSGRLMRRAMRTLWPSHESS